MRIGTCAIGRGGGFRSIRGNGGMWPIGSQSRGIIVPARADPRPFDRSRGFQDGSCGLAELWRGASVPRLPNPAEPIEQLFSFFDQASQ